MTTKQIVEAAKSLGIETYNETEYSVCLIGVNGQASLLYTDKGEAYYKKKINNSTWKAATMKDVAEHLKQMGRDSLKMELNNLLSITQHS